MAQKRGGLGRGLNSLIPNKSKSAEYTALETNNQQVADEISTKNTEKVDKVGEKSENSAPQEKVDDKDKVRMVKISLVEPNREQPRKNFRDEGIDELASSISQYGVIQPLLVQKKDDYYEIIAGERRWRAAKKAGIKEIPVIVREYNNKEAVEISLIENIQREDLNPIEEAMAYERLMKEFSMTQEQVAERVSRSRSAIANALRLLRLPPALKEMVISGAISEGHARALLALPSEDAQLSLAEKVVKDNLSVRETEKVVQNLIKALPKKTKTRDLSKEALLGSLSGQLENVFGTKVAIREGGRHKGRIEIEYYSDEELDRIIELLQSVKN
jgi:ParB family chromosome partitioning protein